MRRTGGPVRSLAARVIRQTRREAIARGTALLSGRADLRTTIVLTGSPRSGTTWLGNVLAARPGTGVLFEPLHIEEVSAARRAGFGWRTYRDPETDWPRGEAFLRRVLEGRLLTAWTTRELGSIRRVQTWVVKFVRANRLLPWMVEHFDTRPPVVIVRHPCAVVSSRLERGWPVAIGSPDDDHPFGADVGRYVASLRFPEERLAAAWALDVLVPLARPRPWPWGVVWFEMLMERGRDHLAPVFERLGLEMPNDVGEMLRTRSRTTTRRGRRDPLDSWKTELEPERIDRVLAVVRRLGITTYDGSPLPQPQGAFEPPAP